MGGVVHLKYDTYATTAPLLPSGKVKVIATAGRSRLAQLPNIPTVAESGFPGYEGYLWIGVLAPRGVPAEAISTLSSALIKGARSPKVAARFQSDGIETPAGGPEELSRLIASELKLWARVVREANIKLSD
jgi:tripartite-type tricarboxylate transporter receptor subunit TctC